MMLMLVAIALALPVAALNVFSFRYLVHLWRLRGEQARRMAIIGAQLREYLDQQQCESSASNLPPRVSN